MFILPTIEDAGDISGKRVLLRLDLNVPVQNGVIKNSFRLDKIIPTINLLRLKKAKIIAFSHITKNKDYDSLSPMWNYLEEFFPIKFSKTYFTEEANAMVANLKDGEVLLFENIRINPEEDANDMEFAKKLANYGHIFINEAFSESHRKQASIIQLPKLLPHYAGPLFVSEMENLSKAFSPAHPFLFILGGAKFETKLPLIKKFLKSADTVFVGGALATNIFKEKGYEVGTSLVSDGDFGIKEMFANPKLKYPIDVTVKKSDGSVVFKNTNEIEVDDYISDCGPKTIEMLKELADKAEFILWNGPFGNYEVGFKDGTEQLAKIISQRTAPTPQPSMLEVGESAVNVGSETIVGGGDTLAAIQSLGVLDKFSFVSTAGGAMLDFLANETLPGIETLIM